VNPGLSPKFEIASCDRLAQIAPPLNGCIIWCCGVRCCVVDHGESIWAVQNLLPGFALAWIPMLAL